jgi:hypothetical protein
MPVANLQINTDFIARRYWYNNVLRTEETQLPLYRIFKLPHFVMLMIVITGLLCDDHTDHL